MAVLHRSSSTLVTRLFFGLTVLCCALGCEKNTSVDSGESLPNSLGRCDGEIAPGWMDVQDLFESHCNECHSSDKENGMRKGAPVAINYDTPENARLNSELTWQMIATDRMPIEETMPFEDAFLIWNWLSCGGPE